jgi:hypothetical protein
MGAVGLIAGGRELDGLSNSQRLRRGRNNDRVHQIVCAASEGKTKPNKQQCFPW